MEKPVFVFATRNGHKLEEIRQILKTADFRLITMEEAGIEGEAEETGKTFEENASLKAVYAASKSGLPALADDSGIEIDALNKEPGVFSARYLGEDTPYSEKNNIILGKLKGVAEENRAARFICAVAAAIPKKIGIETFTTRGVIEGRIAFEPAGENGFGYDPIFFSPMHGKTTAELSNEEKNEASHRGKALRAMAEKLRERGILINATSPR